MSRPSDTRWCFWQEYKKSAYTIVTEYEDKFEIREYFRNNGG